MYTWECNLKCPQNIALHSARNLSLSVYSNRFYTVFCTYTVPNWLPHAFFINVYTSSYTHSECLKYHLCTHTVSWLLQVSITCTYVRTTFRIMFCTWLVENHKSLGYKEPLRKILRYSMCDPPRAKNWHVQSCCMCTYIPDKLSDFWHLYLEIFAANLLTM